MHTGKPLWVNKWEILLDKPIGVCYNEGKWMAGGTPMIHVLCADISHGDEQIWERLYQSATEDRKQRAHRYKRFEDKLRCVTSDALLRRALGTDEFQIQKNPYGKPSVIGRDDFHYNLSHSGNYVVIAFGESEVGVDIQEHRAHTDIPLIAHRCFCQDEQEYIFQCPEETEQRFYEIWTGKESYLKYIGKGLGKSMQSFSVLADTQNRRLLHPIEGYTLTLYAADREYTFELLDLEQL